MVFYLLINLLMSRHLIMTWLGRNRAAGRFSAPRGETLLLLPPRPSQTYTRARGHEGPRGIGSGCEIHSARGDDTTQTVLNKNIEGAQGFCPWSPSQEGARDQSSSARRGLPSKGEARALHHQPAPASTLTMPCFCSTRHSTGGEKPTTLSKTQVD